MGDRYIVTVTNATAGANTVSWTVDRDSFLLQTASASGTMYVTDDPSFTVGGWIVPTKSEKQERLVIIPAQGVDYQIFLKSGRKLYSSFSAQDSGVILLEEATTDLIS
jgi:hypothetical protein